MKKETPRSLKREAGLASGLTTIAPDAGSLLWGETKGKAQSEREKRGLRHTDPRVASSSRPSGTGSRHQMGQRRRLGSGQQDRSRQGNGPAPLRRAGAVRPCLGSGSLHPATAGSTDTGLSLERCGFEKRKWIGTEMTTGLGNTPTISEVQTVVASMHALTRQDLKNQTRKRSISHPRQEAMYLARELTGCSYPQIAMAFGGMDHTSVLFGFRKISARVPDDEKLAARMNECRARIAQLVAERIGKYMTMQASSSDWSPPPQARTGWLISKPSTVIASIDGAAWLACAA